MIPTNSGHFKKRVFLTEERYLHEHENDWQQTQLHPHSAEYKRESLKLATQIGVAKAANHVLVFEINNAPDRQRANIIKLINQLSKEVIPLTEKIRQRAKTFEAVGVQAFDALHLASAEENADVFLTTDDQFLKKAQQISGLTIKVSNPLHWLEEILP